MLFLDFFMNGNVGGGGGGSGITSAQAISLISSQLAKGSTPLPRADGQELSPALDKINIVDDGATVTLPTATPTNKKIINVQINPGESFTVGGTTYDNTGTQPRSFFLTWDGTNAIPTDEAIVSSDLDTSKLAVVWQASQDATYPVDQLFFAENTVLRKVLPGAQGTPAASKLGYTTEFIVVDESGFENWHNRPGLEYTGDGTGGTFANPGGVSSFFVEFSSESYRNIADGASATGIRLPFLLERLYTSFANTTFRPDIFAGGLTYIELIVAEITKMIAGGIKKVTLDPHQYGTVDGQHIATPTLRTWYGQALRDLHMHLRGIFGDQIEIIVSVMNEPRNDIGSPFFSTPGNTTELRAAAALIEQISQAVYDAIEPVDPEFTIILTSYPVNQMHTVPTAHPVAMYLTGAKAAQSAAKGKVWIEIHNYSDKFHEGRFDDKENWIQIIIDMIAADANQTNLFGKRGKRNSMIGRMDYHNHAVNDWAVGVRVFIGEVGFPNEAGLNNNATAIAETAYAMRYFYNQAVAFGWIVAYWGSSGADGEYNLAAIEPIETGGPLVKNNFTGDILAEYNTGRASPVYNPAPVAIAAEATGGVQEFILTAGDPTMKTEVDGSYVNVLNDAAVTPVFPAIAPAGTIIELFTTVDTTLSGQDYPASDPIDASYFFESNGTVWTNFGRTFNPGQLIFPDKATMDKYGDGGFLSLETDAKSLDPSGSPLSGKFTLKNTGSNNEFVWQGDL